MSKVRYAMGRLQGKAEWWGPLGWMQFGFLFDRGLRPYHTLLDIGCGTFRAGRLFMKYLDVGNYYGIDESKTAIELGIKKVLEQDSELTGEQKQPHLRAFALTAEPMNFRAIIDCPDYVWIHDVFIHTGPEIARRAILDLACVLKGEIYATAFISDDREPVIWTKRASITTKHNAEFWHFSQAFFPSVAQEAGLQMEMEEEEKEYTHPYPLKVLRFFV